MDAEKEVDRRRWTRSGISCLVTQGAMSMLFSRTMPSGEQQTVFGRNTYKFEFIMLIPKPFPLGVYAAAAAVTPATPAASEFHEYILEEGEAGSHHGRT